MLAPFAEITSKASSSTSSTADVIPTATHSNVSYEGNSGIKTMKRTLLQAVTRQMSTADDKPPHRLAMTLSPTCRGESGRSLSCQKQHSENVNVVHSLSLRWV